MFPGVFADGDLSIGLSRRTNKAGAQRFGLLPNRSKNGNSLAKMFGITGAALDAKISILRDSLKVRMGSISGAVSTSSDYTGGSYTLRGNGDIAMVWKRLAGGGKVTREVAIAGLTPEDAKNIPDEVKLKIIADYESATPAKS